MKYYTILIFFVCTLAYSSNIEIIPLNTNFNGLINTPYNILIYGDNAVYFLSTDKGDTWQQKTLNEFGNIVQMTFEKDKIYGVLDNGVIVRSDDYGKTWIKKKMTLNSGDKCISSYLSNNKFFIRTLNSIKCFYDDLNFAYESIDPLLKLDQSYYIYYKCFFVLDTLLFATIYKDNHSSVLIMNENLVRINDENLNQIINCKYCILDDVFNYQSKVVVKVDDNLFFTNENLTDLQPVLKDTNILNNLINSGLMSYTLNIINNKIYIASSKQNNAFKIGRYFGYPTTNHNIGINIVDNIADSLKLVGNYFENKYYTYTSDPNYFLWDGIYSSVYFNKLSVIEDSIFILYGQNKTILISKNNGISWKLLSYFPFSVPKLILNDSTFYFVTEETDNVGIYRSDDSGLTFKPVELMDSVSHYQHFSNAPVFYMDSTGNGFFTGNKAVDSYKNNFAFTKDFGKSYKFLSFNDIYIFPNDMYSSNIIKAKDKYIFATNLIRGKNYSYLHFLDTNYSSIKRIKIDSLYQIHHIVSEDPKELTCYTSYNDSIYSKPYKFEISYSIDSGKTKNPIITFPINGEISQIFEYNKDSIFISSTGVNRVYLFDKKRLKIDTVFINDESDLSFLKVIYLKNRFYLIGDNFFKESIQKNDFSNFRDVHWDNSQPYFTSVISGNNSLVASLKDSLRALNFYKLNFNDTIETNVSQTETRYATPQELNSYFKRDKKSRVISQKKELSIL